MAYLMYLKITPKVLLQVKIYEILEFIYFLMQEILK